MTVVADRPTLDGSQGTETAGGDGILAPRRTAASGRRRLAVCVAAALGAILVTATAAGDSIIAQTIPGHWRLTWSDEFIGPPGTAPDPALWRPHTGGHGWGNEEREMHTADTANAALDGNGHLAITARRDTSGVHTCWYGPCTYTSARLTTLGTFSPQYGRIEARIRLPHGRGMWPAFWMLGANGAEVGWLNGGEIDIMENVGHDMRTVFGSLHGPGPRYGKNGLTAAYRLPGGASFADDFHTFAVTWAPDTISWFVDGHRYQTRTPADTGSDGWVFNHPFFLVLNLAVGGTWPGDPDTRTPFPQSMLVDYVRIYEPAG
ncbi:glycoside hydrolase family 16 protein [Geodermatophilus sp. URMC 65]